MMNEIQYIIVSEIGDSTTKAIANWLSYKGEEVRILNSDLEQVEISSIQINKGSTEFKVKSSDDFKFSSKQKKVVFFRKGMLRLQNSTHSFSGPGDFSDIGTRVRYFFTTYELAKSEIINFFFSKDVKYGVDNGSRTNKIINLHKAREIGLNIPDTILTTSKNELKTWSLNKKQIITKSIDIGMFYGDIEKMKMYHQLTKTIETNFVNHFNDNFPLTIFQEKIEKILELRVFYLRGKIWTSAIISQFQKNTQEDYRNYDPDKMNRIVPYQLPEVEELKIKNFMIDIGLETGSIDLILASDNLYYFLEVNPNGQFGYVSNLCNYYLEREIAKNMIEYGQESN